jgi:NADH:ubiquinone oxidoreductase subunit 3 (subunit A)
MFFSLLCSIDKLTIFNNLLQLHYYFFFLSFLSCLIIIFWYFLSPTNENMEKLSSYECGFEPFGDARSNFDVQFYLVGILFLIFDLEIVFLYPWIFSIYNNGLFYFYNLFFLFFFLFLLALGFFYEWRKRALNWSSSF